jgi:hypothetical protein
LDAGEGQRHSTETLADVKMTVSARIRFTLAAVVLAAVYYYLLVFLVGWTSVHERPGWWLGVFPTRHLAVITWLITLHSVAVLLAALPVAVATVLIARREAVLLGLTVAVLATVVAVAPSLSSTIWPLIWDSHPIFFITDQIKLIVAVPAVAWVLRAASSNNRLERSRNASSVSPGGSR